MSKEYFYKIVFYPPQTSKEKDKIKKKVVSMVNEMQLPYYYNLSNGGYEIHFLAQEPIKQENLMDINTGELRIETQMEDTEGPIYYSVIDSISFPVEVKKRGGVIKDERRFLEVGDLLGEQAEKDKNKEEEEIRKDNDRPKV